MLPFLIVAGIVGLVAYATSAGASTSSQSSGGSSWPPSAGVQNSILQQMIVYATNATGEAPATSDISMLQQIVAALPQQYLSTTGGPATTSAYQAWVWQNWGQLLQNYYASGGTGTSGAFGGNPYSYGPPMQTS